MPRQSSTIFQVMKEESVLFCLPDNPFFLFNNESGHAVQEATYACKIIFGSLLPSWCVLICLSWQIADGFSLSISATVSVLRTFNSGTSWMSLIRRMLKCSLIFRGDSVRRPLLGKVYGRSFMPTRSWVSYILKCLKWPDTLYLFVSNRFVCSM